MKFGGSKEIAVEDNETFPVEVKDTFYNKSNGTFFDESNGAFLGESNKTSENLTMFGYEIAHFNDTHAEVRNTIER